MAIQSNKGKQDTFSEINITPLTDIFLVLLIIMMVMAPTFQSMNKDINVPEINSGVNVDKDKVTVAVTKEGLFFVNGKPIETDNLENEMKAVIDQTEKKIVLVRADSKTKNSEIMKIIKAAQVTGYEKLTVAGEPLSKKQQKELVDSSSDSENADQIDVEKID